MTEPDTPLPAVPEGLARWTLERMSAFIETLRRTRNVAAAARAVRMSRCAAYRPRARLVGHPFDRTWTAAMAPCKAFRRMAAGCHAGAPRGAAPSQVVTGGDRG